MKKKILTLVALATLASCTLQAQKEDKNLKVSGYIQTEMEVAGKDAKTKTGANTSWKEGADDGDYFLRYGLRRSRLKIQYTKGIAKGVFETDISEGGVKPKNAFLQIDAAPWISIQSGLVTLWYGHEVGYSSSELEVLERSKWVQDLFPDEKDLALRVSLKALKGSAFEGLDLDLGLLSGNAINKTPDGRVNFLGRLGYKHSLDKMKYAVGLSYYYGKTNNASDVWYEIEDKQWVAKNVQANKKNNRQYFGIDAQLSFQSSMGWTNIQAEYTLGEQPSQKGSLKSPQANTYSSEDAFAYNRKFMGCYLYLIQDISTLPMSAILKWAYTDNNRQISGNQVSNKGDLAYNDFAIGLMYKINSSLRLTAIYDIVKNEKTNQITNYDKDLKDDIFTLRLQYKF